MKIGIIGAGHIGGTLARRLVAAGHDVAVSNSRGPETLAGASSRSWRARVVKAFNAILWTRLRDDGRPAGDPRRLGIPISGDDEAAVAELIDQIGFEAVDAGTLAEGGRRRAKAAGA